MYDVSNVGLVDTHAKGNRSNYHIDALHQEIVLRSSPLRRFHTGMIGTGTDGIGTQHLRQLLYTASAQAIDDAALASVLKHKARNILVHILRLGTDFVIKIRAIERALELRSIRNSQTLLDVGTHLVRCRCRQSNDGRTANLVYKRTNVTVLWAEIMAPLRNTMRLVNSIERNLRLGKETHILLLGQRLGSHIKQFRPSVNNVLLHHVNLRLGKRRVEIVRNAVVVSHLTYGINLILHERNEGRHHNGRALAYQRRQLVTKRFATTSGH